MFIPDLGSRILIFTHPGSRIPDLGSRISDPGSRIPDPKTATKEGGEKKLVVIRGEIQMIPESVNKK
jgi:hypothetical protein